MVLVGVYWGPVFGRIIIVSDFYGKTTLLYVHRSGVAY